MKSKQKIFSKTFQLTSKKKLTLQISHQIILQVFQQESTRKFQVCLKIRPEGKSSKSLWTKLYAIKELDGEEEKNCKGVKRNVIRHKISFNDYKDVLFSRKEVLRTMNVIRSRQHNLSRE